MKFLDENGGFFGWITTAGLAGFNAWKYMRGRRRERMETKQVEADIVGQLSEQVMDLHEKYSALMSTQQMTLLENAKLKAKNLELQARINIERNGTLE